MGGHRTRRRGRRHRPGPSRGGHTQRNPVPAPLSRSRAGNRDDANEQERSDARRSPDSGIWTPDPGLPTPDSKLRTLPAAPCDAMPRSSPQKCDVECIPHARCQKSSCARGRRRRRRGWRWGEQGASIRSCPCWCAGRGGVRRGAQALPYVRVGIWLIQEGGNPVCYRMAGRPACHASVF